MCGLILEPVPPLKFWNVQVSQSKYALPSPRSPDPTLTRMSARPTSPPVTRSSATMSPSSSARPSMTTCARRCKRSSGSARMSTRRSVLSTASVTARTWPRLCVIPSQLRSVTRRLRRPASGSLCPSTTRSSASTRTAYESPSLGSSGTIYPQEQVNWKFQKDQFW